MSYFTFSILPFVTPAGELHGALPWEVEGWLVAVQGMLYSFGWGYSMETVRLQD